MESALSETAADWRFRPRQVARPFPAGGYRL